nr:MAG TPA: hypothetical protein [Caudoviricetes sp.]
MRSRQRSGTNHESRSRSDARRRWDRNTRLSGIPLSAVTGSHPPPRKARRPGHKTARPDQQTPGCKSRAGTTPAPHERGARHRKENR